MFGEFAPRPAPLFVPALGFTLGIACSLALGDVDRRSEIILAAASLALFAAALLRPVRSSTASVALLLFLLSGAAGFARSEATRRRSPNHVSHFLCDEPFLVRVLARVDSKPIRLEPVRRHPYLPYDPLPQVRFVAQLMRAKTSAGERPLRGVVRVSIGGEIGDFAPGDVLELTGLLQPPRHPRNPGETDWARWEFLQGIDARLSVESGVHVRRVATSASPLAASVNAIRGVARRVLLEPEAAIEPTDAQRLLDTMILGQRSAVTRAVNDAFIRTGTIHFLSVSGFHVGVLAGATWWVVRRLLRRSSRATAGATAVVLVMYGLIAEPNAATTRATLMGLLGCAAVWLRRPLSTLNWLALSAVAILALNPRELLRPGFQLSFAQVYFLFTLVPAVHARLTRPSDFATPPEDAHTWGALLRRRTAGLLLGLTLVSVLLWLSALPLTLFHFQQIAPFSSLQTMILTPWIVATTLLGFVSLLLGWFPVLGAWLVAALHQMTDWLLSVVGLLARTPGSLRAVESPPAALVIGSYVLMGTLAAYSRVATIRPDESQGSDGARRWWRARVICLTAMLALVSLWSGWLLTPRAAAAPSHPTAVVLSVGSGNTRLLIAPNRDALVLDVGTNTNTDAGTTALNALHALGAARLKGLLVSHADADHYSGAASLLASLPSTLLVPSYVAAVAGSQPSVAEFLRQTGAAPREVVHAGASLRLAETVLDILWPPADLEPGWADNDLSIVARWSVGSATLLAPGDIEDAAMSALLGDAETRARLRADVLIAPHHGAVVTRTAEFLTAVRPHTVIISSLTPRPKLTALVRQTLGDACRVLNTRDVGAVLVRMESGRVVVSTPFQQ